MSNALVDFGAQKITRRFLTRCMYVLGHATQWGSTRAKALPAGPGLAGHVHPQELQIFGIEIRCKCSGFDIAIEISLKHFKNLF